MTVITLPEARDDLIEIALFYEEIEGGLGIEVYEFLEKQIDALSETGGMHRKIGALHRLVVLGRFPYFAVFYRVNSNAAEVCAVIDCRRDPEWNSDLLGKR
jgi:plasmid stabilization system protein ParE